MFAQALTAASHTVAADRIPHSIHGHFLRPGRPEVPIAFRVERDRDGARFPSRRVAAYQVELMVFPLCAYLHPSSTGFAPPDAIPPVTPPAPPHAERTQPP